ncbi:MAG: hypothetical protein HQ498_10820 [Pseudohongiella sp.]|nr:hypothetical protein [Pseudohongiella sp.]
MLEKFRMGMNALTEMLENNLSHAARGLVLMFAAVPIIVFIKYDYDDNILLGAVVPIMLAFGAIELSNKEDKEIVESKEDQ